MARNTVGTGLCLLLIAALGLPRVHALPRVNTPDGPRFTLTDLGPLPRVVNEIAPGLSANGAVVAWATRPTGGFEMRYWQRISDLPARLPARKSPTAALSVNDLFAADVNTQGLVVGLTRDPHDLRFTQAFQWREGDSAATLLPTLGGAHASARAVSETNLIVGGADLPSGLHHACFWRNKVVQDLGTLPGGDFSVASAVTVREEIVGLSDVTPNGKNHAFLWHNGKMQDLGLLPGGTQSAARAVSATGDVVGYGDDYGREIHPILWHKGHPTDLGTLGDDPAAAWSINSVGQVVGTSAIGPGKMRAFFWQHGLMRDLNELIPAHTGWILETAYRINRRGWILGTGRLRGESRLFLLRPISQSSIFSRTKANAHVP